MSNALRANDDVDAVGVFDSQGRLVAGFTRSGHGRPAFAGQDTHQHARPGHCLRPGGRGRRQRWERSICATAPSRCRSRLSRYIAPGLSGRDGVADVRGDDAWTRGALTACQPGAANPDRRARKGRGRAAPEPEDGGDRPADRRHRPRFQQHAGDHHGQPRPAAAPLCRRRPEAAAAWPIRPWTGPSAPRR